MKVTTDACLFGAIAAKEIASKNVPGHLLDIGSGTGLLALMIAQQNPAMHIDAVELDDSAAQQALENVANSVMKDQISVIHADLKSYHSTHHYDVVISNPPFYKDHLKSPDVKRNFALHDSSLTLTDLLRHIIRLVKPTGIIGVLLPTENTNAFVELAGKLNWNCYLQIAVRQTENHKVFRKISFFKLQPSAPLHTSQLTIKQNGEYSQTFIAHLKDYYLYL